MQGLFKPLLDLGPQYVVLIVIVVTLQYFFRFERAREHLSVWRACGSRAQLEQASAKIHSQLSYLEFPFTGRTAMELGFFYTFGIEGIASVLAKSGQFDPALVRKVRPAKLPRQAQILASSPRPTSTTCTPFILTALQ